MGGREKKCLGFTILTEACEIGRKRHVSITWHNLKYFVPEISVKELAKCHRYYSANQL
jgi:hypothetical protein